MSPIDARRALEIGLVNRVVPADQLMDEALALAGTIAENAPLAVRASKQVMKQAGELPEAEGWAINNAAVPEVFGSADAMEGADRLRREAQAQLDGQVAVRRRVPT